MRTEWPTNGHVYGLPVDVPESSRIRIRTLPHVANRRRRFGHSLSWPLYAFLSIDSNTSFHPFAQHSWSYQFALLYLLIKYYWNTKSRFKCNQLQLIPMTNIKRQILRSLCFYRLSAMANCKDCTKLLSKKNFLFERTVVGLEWKKKMVWIWAYFRVVSL